MQNIFVYFTWKQTKEGATEIAKVQQKLKAPREQGIRPRVPKDVQWDFTIVFMANFIVKSREMSFVPHRLFVFEDNGFRINVSFPKFFAERTRWKIFVAISSKNKVNAFYFSVNLVNRGYFLITLNELWILRFNTIINCFIKKLFFYV